MARNGGEGLGSMGTDTPLACLCEKPQLLYAYFKQLFAQVTNPPLDANFEELVTSLYTYLGREGNLLDESPRACHLIKLEQPILANSDLEKLREVNTEQLRSVTLPMLFNVAEGEAGCEGARCALRGGRQKAVQRRRIHFDPLRSGRERDARADPQPAGDRRCTPLPGLKGIRTQCGLVIETGEAREVHHFCLLIGYGAGAVNPYLAFETLGDMHREARFRRTSPWRWPRSITSRRPTRESSRSPRRWGSAPSRATAGRRSSRPSG